MFELHDWVRAIDGENAGSIGMISNIDHDDMFPYLVVFSPGNINEYFNADEISAWVPRAGERVMFTRPVDDQDMTGKSGVVFGEKHLSLGRAGYDLDIIVDHFTEGHGGDADDDSDNHFYCDVADLEPLFPDPNDKPIPNIFKMKLNRGDYVALIYEGDGIFSCSAQSGS